MLRLFTKIVKFHLLGRELTERHAKRSGRGRRTTSDPERQSESGDERNSAHFPGLAPEVDLRIPGQLLQGVEHFRDEPVRGADHVSVRVQSFQRRSADAKEWQKLEVLLSFIGPRGRHNEQTLGRCRCSSVLSTLQVVSAHRLGRIRSGQFGQNHWWPLHADCRRKWIFSNFQLSLVQFNWQIVVSVGASLGQVVMGGDWHTVGCEFESQHCILYGHF